MSDTVAIAAFCLVTGVVAASLCSLLVLPPAAWAATMVLSRPIRHIADDAIWQAPFAAIAAALPGALFLTIAAYGLIRASSSMCLATPVGRAVFGVIAFLAMFAIARAAMLACRRSLEVKQLSGRAYGPSPRLAVAARAVSLPARELHDVEPFCALTGIWRPVVLVSRGALERLSDDELHAALQHEAAHAKRGDPLLAAVVALFSDLLPLPTNDLIKTYHKARELAADDHAARNTNATDLAAAILAIARGKGAPSAVPALAASDGVPARIIKLLNAGTESTSPSIPRRLTIGASLVAVFLVGVAPVAASIITHWTCSKMGMP